MGFKETVVIQVVVNSPLNLTVPVFTKIVFDTMIATSQSDTHDSIA